MPGATLVGNGATDFEEVIMKTAALSMILACGLCASLGPQTLAQHAGEHIMLDPSELTWKDLPSLPGVKIAIIEGALDQQVPIMFRLKFPADFKVPPHWHPGVEHITIISGTLHMGIGNVFDTSKTRALKAGSISIMQPGTHHYVWTSEETIGQVHSIGPWAVNYVNPADDPAKKK
jgi:quercetin dioxygenase-like cupin family protein